MAERPVFMPYDKAPFYRAVTVSFEWNGGFAKTQKQKNIRALHEAFVAIRPEGKVLEISSKSMQESGEDLSAFFLRKYVPSLHKKVPVECVFQSAKVFENGGPYKDILEMTPRDAKRDERLRNSGRLVCFSFEGKEFPLEPRTAFYDYIYLNALLENKDLAQTVLQHDAFTDIEFNPNKSLNCQAKAAAAFVALSRLGLTDQIKTFGGFLELNNNYPSEHLRMQKENTNTSISEGDKVTLDEMNLTDKKWITHKLYGKGRILSVDEMHLLAEFFEVGQKKLGTQWCMKNCRIE